MYVTNGHFARGLWHRPFTGAGVMAADQDVRFTTPDGTKLYHYMGTSTFACVPATPRSALYPCPPLTPGPIMLSALATALLLATTHLLHMTITFDL